MFTQDSVRRFVRTSHDEGGPARRVLEVEALHRQASRVLGVEQDRTQVSVVRVKNPSNCQQFRTPSEYNAGDLLKTGELVPPPLAIAVENTLSVQLHLVATPLPEHDGILERVGEGILLPVGSVVGELDLTLPVNVHIVQPGQVERLADDEGLVSGEVERAAVVGLLQTLDKLIRDVVQVVLGGADGVGLAVAVLSALLVRVLLAKLLDVTRNAGRKLNRAGERSASSGQGGEEGRDSHGCVWDWTARRKHTRRGGLPSEMPRERAARER